MQPADRCQQQIARQCANQDLGSIKRLTLFRFATRGLVSSSLLLSRQTRRATTFSLPPQGRGISQNNPLACVARNVKLHGTSKRPRICASDAISSTSKTRSSFRSPRLVPHPSLNRQQARMLKEEDRKGADSAPQLLRKLLLFSRAFCNIRSSPGQAQKLFGLIQLFTAVSGYAGITGSCLTALRSICYFDSLLEVTLGA